MIQSHPHLGGLPRLGQSDQCGHHGSQSRGPVGGNVHLREAIRVRVASRILVNGRQAELSPLAGLGELYLSGNHKSKTRGFIYAAPSRQ